MPEQVEYLIIGGGMAAAAAMQGIREVDSDGSIGLISADISRPYARPPLSKALWKGETTVDKIMRELPDKVDITLERTAHALDLENNRVIDDLGDIYTYQKLLLTTGGTPRKFPFGGDNIIYYRTLSDYQRLRELSETQDKFVVIGGSFIGSELAAALSMQDKQVTMIFPEPAICQRIFPPELASYLNQYYRDKGVEVLHGETINGLDGSGNDLTVTTESGRRIAANGVVAGIGIEPNVELAKAAGLKVDNGIVVDSALQTSHAGVFAAGDAANFYDEALHDRRRVEHVDNAVSMGKTAGRSMAGDKIQYDYSPMFYSDLFDLGYEAVGVLDSEMDTVVDWQEPYVTGVIYYLKDRRVRGVLLWNVWEKLEEAKALIAEGQRVDPETLKGRIQ